AFRDLDDEQGTRRMRVAVSARIAWHHGNIRLGLRGVVERNRKLRVDLPLLTQSVTQSGEHSSDGRRVTTALRFSHQKKTVDQLQALAGFEDVQIHEALILRAAPPSRFSGKNDDVGL